MLSRWLIYLFWRPFELFARWNPLLPLQLHVKEVAPGVQQLCLQNFATRLLTSFSGGYEYAVCFIIDDEILFDSGYAWGERRLVQYLRSQGLETKLSAIVSSHFHEDHCGNNKGILELCPQVTVYAHPLDAPYMIHPTVPSWYRRFLFGPVEAHQVSILPAQLQLRSGRRLKRYDTPGHTPGHICLYDQDNRILFGGDLFLDVSVDSQLPEVNALDWIESLKRISELDIQLFLDGHGVVLRDDEIHAQLRKKLRFLEELRARVHEVVEAEAPMTLNEVVKVVFSKKDFVDQLSMSEGWMSVITGGSFSRSNLIRAFVDEAVTHRHR